jgi:hypothetical protein
MPLAREAASAARPLRLELLIESLGHGMNVLGVFAGRQVFEMILALSSAAH